MSNQLIENTAKNQNDTQQSLWSLQFEIGYIILRATSGVWRASFPPSTQSATLATTNSHTTHTIWMHFEIRQYHLIKSIENATK